MNARPIIEALVAAFIALEDGNASQIDPDFAVQVMEDMGAALHHLDADDRGRFTDVLNEIAQSAEAEWYRSFVLRLAGMIWGPQES